MIKWEVIDQDTDQPIETTSLKCKLNIDTSLEDVEEFEKNATDALLKQCRWRAYTMCIEGCNKTPKDCFSTECAEYLDKTYKIGTTHLLNNC